MTNIKSLQDKLKQVEQDNLMVGYHFEAISSIINYPEDYELGKQSVHMECRYCGLHPKHQMDAEYIRDTGRCFKCDELAWECYYEGLAERNERMEEYGLDPDNPEDVEDFMEGGDC